MKVCIIRYKQVTAIYSEENISSSTAFVNSLLAQSGPLRLFNPMFHMKSNVLTLKLLVD